MLVDALLENKERQEADRDMTVAAILSYEKGRVKKRAIERPKVTIERRRGIRTQKHNYAGERESV